MLIISGLLACAQVEDRRVQTDERWPLAFIMELDRDGVIVQVGEAFSLSDDDPGARVSKLQLMEADHEASLVAFSGDDLRALAPNVDFERMRSALIVSKLFASPSLHPFVDPVFADITAGDVYPIESSGFGDLRPAAAVLQGSLLRLPTTPEYCRPGLPDRLVPFGASVDVLEDFPYGSVSLNAVLILDKDLLLVAGEDLVAPLARGGAVELSQALIPSEALNQRVFLAGLVRDDDGRITAYGRRLGATTGVLIDLEVTDEGVTITATVSTEAPVSDAMFDPRGFFVFGGNGLWIRPFGGALQTVVPPEPDQAIRTMSLTHDAEAPHLVASDAWVYVGDALEGRWSEPQAVTLPIGSSGILTSAVSDDGAERWVLGSASLASRWTRGLGWRDFDAPIPPSSDCVGVGEVVDLRSSSARLTEATFAGEDLLTVARSCGGIYYLNSDQSCLDSIPIMDRVMRTEDSLTALAYRDKEVIVVGQQGQVLSAQLP